jgi:hypothetical protein
LQFWVAIRKNLKAEKFQNSIFSNMVLYFAAAKFMMGLVYILMLPLIDPDFEQALIF